MNILFVTFGELSVEGAGARSVSILRTLADAGHQVDVVASRVALSEHSNIHVLTEETARCVPIFRLRIITLKALMKGSYDVIHVVDCATFFVSKIARWFRIRFVYEASRCFTGSVGDPPFRLWKWFPKTFQGLEKKMLRKARVVLTPWQLLADDLLEIEPEANIVSIGNIPLQSLFSGREMDRDTLLESFNGGTTSIVVCSVLAGSRLELRKLLMAARKVVEAVPQVALFFKGISEADASDMAEKLDIRGRCLFLAPNESELFLAALDRADATLLIPSSDGRYQHPEVFTLLRASAPLVLLEHGAYCDLLTEANSLSVLSSSESMAEGLLRAIQEPLFSLGIATQGQNLVANQYTLSSFKHKIRTIYHEL